MRSPRFVLLTACTALLAVSFLPRTATAQDPPAPATDTTRQELLRVFLDCQTFGCDFDFLRTEIQWVNFVRDRGQSDLHLLVTGLSTGSGGREFTLVYIGQGSRADMVDTLRYNSGPTDTQDLVRRGLARTIARGLFRYAAQTSIADRLTIAFRPTPQPGTASSRGARDPWNAWVFRIGMNASGDGEKAYRSSRIGGSIRASRTTAEWKANFTVSGNYNESQFRLSTGTFTNYRNGMNIEGLLVNSLGEHWSAGFLLSAQKSTFLNYDLQVALAPAVEYDIFPYSQSTQRQIRLQYSVAMNHFDYTETTIYGHERESRPQHRFEVLTDLRQPWGSVGGSIRYSQYLHDLSKRSTSIFAAVRWRIVTGLDFNIAGSYAKIGDQLYLPRGELTDEDVLVRLRQLETGYRYFGNVGLSYTFGSIFNNVVNPRFGGGDGGFFFF